MKNPIQRKKTLLILLLLLFSLPAMAQFDDPDDTEDNEEDLLNPAPIDDYLVPMLLIGVAAGFYLVRRKSTVEIVKE